MRGTTPAPRQQRRFLRNPDVPFTTRFGVVLLGSVLLVLAIGLPTVGLISHELGERRSTYTCTVRSVAYSPLRGGGAAWDVRTGCGGTITIDPSAAGQTVPEAQALAGELRSGHRYRLTVEGALHTPLDFSVELLRAVPAR